MQNECAFCDRNQFEERIIGEVDGFWLIATLGQISDGGYVLVVPKEHIPCIGAIEDGRTNSFFRTTQFVSHIVAVEYRRWDEKTYPPPVIYFEHGIVGQTIQHAHLHVVPAIFNITQKVGTDFSDIPIEKLGYAGRLLECYKNRPQPYLYWTDPSRDGREGLVCWNPPAPKQYLRIVAAELLGRPERANWRAMDPELDRRLYLETVTRLKPYFS